MDIFNENGVTVQGVVYNSLTNDYEEVDSEEEVQFYGLYSKNDEGLRVHVTDFPKDQRDEALKHAKAMAETLATMDRDAVEPEDTLSFSDVVDIPDQIRKGIITVADARRRIRQSLGITVKNISEDVPFDRIREAGQDVYSTFQEGIKTANQVREELGRQQDRVQVYEDSNGNWRWRRVDGSGEILATSPKGYSKPKAVLMAYRVNRTPYINDMEE